MLGSLVAVLVMYTSKIVFYTYGGIHLHMGH